jgi:hypothetical protein
MSLAGEVLAEEVHELLLNALHIIKQTLAVRLSKPTMAQLLKLQEWGLRRQWVFHG